MAKTLDTLVKLHHFEVEEQQRILAQLQDAVIGAQAAHERLVVEMAVQRATAAGDFTLQEALPRYLEAALARLVTIAKHIEILKKQSEDARDELQRRFETLKSFELAAQAERERATREQARREQADLDEVASNASRRADQDS